MATKSKKEPGPDKNVVFEPEVFDNQLELYLLDFCEKYQIDDMKKESQNVWNGFLMWVCKHTFKKNKYILRDRTIINNNSATITTLDKYDINKVSNMVDIYINMCLLNDKEVSIIGFTYLTNINQDTIYTWGNDTRESSREKREIYKKLSAGREESLSAKLSSGKVNPVGILAILNRHYSWNLPGVSREQSGTQRVTAAEIRQMLSDNSKQLGLTDGEQFIHNSEE